MKACNSQNQNLSACHQNETLHQPEFLVSNDEFGSTVKIAIPGVRKEDLKLTLLESSLRVRASRHEETPQSWKTRFDGDRITGYRLDLRLGSRLDGTRASASLDSGILTLNVPLREESRPRQIEVN